MKELAALSLLDTMHSAQLVVFLRVVAAGADHKPTVITNPNLHAERRTAARVIRDLIRMRLVGAKYVRGVRFLTVR